MMVRALVLVVAMVLTSCGSGGRLITPDPDRDAVRGAVVGFLDALAGREDGPRLSTTIRGPLLEDWTTWLGSRGSREGGTVDIRALQVAGLDGEVAQVNVDATITLGRGGSEARLGHDTVTLRGPVVLVRDAEAGSGWLITDLVREGRPMSAAVTIFDPPAEATAGGIRVQLRSLYRFGTGTVANVRIANGSERAVRMDRPPTRIQAAGRFVGATAAAVSFRGDIAPGASPDGSVGFHQVPLRWLPEKLMVHLENGTVVTVDLPVEAFVPSTTEA